MNSKNEINKEKFLENYKSKKNQIVYKTISSDLDTPLSVFIKLKDLSEYRFLYESVEAGKNRSRYSIITLMPDLVWECYKKEVCIKRMGDDNKLLSKQEFKADEINALDSLDKLLKESYINIREIDDNLPQMIAGIFGYMGYEMVKLMEDIKDDNIDITSIPDAIFIRPKIVIVFDSVKDTMIIATPVYLDEEYDGNKDEDSVLLNIFDKKNELINEIIKKLSSSLDRSYYSQNISYQDNKPSVQYENIFSSNVTKEYFCDMVTKSKEYIRNGDIFQILPSQRFVADFDLDHIAFYRSLRSINPSPFLFSFHFPDFSIIGSSPEILVRIDENEKVTVRPLAGTRKRGKDAEEDQKIAEELLSDEKELAEHLMLIDLGRNDVGRIAKKGSVKVPKQMEIEFYSHILHISSTVEGDMDFSKYSCMDAIKACFPAGTVSGAPKIRAMEIIEELEMERRSFYSGMIGYFSANNKSMDTAITLRTALIKDKKIYIQAGAGVVMDSIEENEYQETINKASALFKAVLEAEKFAK